MNHRKFNHAFQTVCDMVAVICQYKNQEIVKICEKNPPKWQKHDLVSGGHGRAAKLGACVNWVDWLRTSADKRMWSGRRADDDCFYYHSWRNNVVIAFGTLSSFLT